MQLTDRTLHRASEGKQLFFGLTNKGIRITFSDKQC